MCHCRGAFHCATKTQIQLSPSLSTPPAKLVCLCGCSYPDASVCVVVELALFCLPLRLLRFASFVALGNWNKCMCKCVKIKFISFSLLLFKCLCQWQVSIRKSSITLNQRGGKQRQEPHNKWRHCYRHRREGYPESHCQCRCLCLCVGDKATSPRCSPMRMELGQLGRSFPYVMKTYKLARVPYETV